MDAEKAYKKALAQDARNPIAARHLSELYMETERYELAFKTLSEFEDNSGEKSMVAEARAFLLRVMLIQDKDMFTETTQKKIREKIEALLLAEYNPASEYPITIFEFYREQNETNKAKEFYAQHKSELIKYKTGIDYLLDMDVDPK